MKQYVICDYVGHPTKVGVRVPRLYMHMKDFEVKGSSGSGYAIVIVDAGITIPQAAIDDTRILVLGAEADLDRTLTGGQRNAVNTHLATTDWGVTAVAGDTPRALLNKIRIALGHSAESWGLGL